MDVRERVCKMKIPDLPDLAIWPEQPEPSDPLSGWDKSTVFDYKQFLAVITYIVSSEHLKWQIDCLIDGHIW
jgi:hypothetical protein